MTRFALIPLAFFANACASAEDAQETLNDTTEDVRAAFDELEGDQDRSTAAFGNHIVRVTERMFRADMADAGCSYIAAVAGGWRNYTSKTTLNVFDTSGHHAFRLQGVMKWDDNASGQLLAKGHSASDDMTVTVEADWLNNEIDGDIFFSGNDNPTYRLFGEKRNRGTGGLVIGAVGLCKE